MGTVVEEGPLSIVCVRDPRGVPSSARAQPERGSHPLAMNSDLILELRGARAFPPAAARAAARARPRSNVGTSVRSEAVVHAPATI